MSHNDVIMQFAYLKICIWSQWVLQERNNVVKATKIIFLFFRLYKYIFVRFYKYIYCNLPNVSFLWMLYCFSMTDIDTMRKSVTGFSQLGSGVALVAALVETGTAEERCVRSHRSPKYQKSLQEHEERSLDFKAKRFRNIKKERKRRVGKS